MINFLFTLLLIGFADLSFFTTKAGAASFFEGKNRKHISVVGSSTAYPFVATIAETFGRESGFKTPIVEANGTGGGFKLFCAGIGYEFPDFVNASRRIEKSELERCRGNKISAREIKIGYDGIVLANSINGKNYSLTKREIFLGLAAKLPDKNGELQDNPNQHWSDIDPSLPASKIVVYGPPSSSGTRDSFAELVLEAVCVKEPAFIKAFADEKLRRKKCRLIRSDHKFIEAGENDNLIVQKLNGNPDALGVFGFSFLAQNQEKIKAAIIDKTAPSFASIASGAYTISRPLFIYFKTEHLDLVAGMREFIAEITNKNTIGPDGYLMQKGLVPLQSSELKKAEDIRLDGRI